MLAIVKKLMINPSLLIMINFKCWLNQSGSEQSLYLAILPLFESSNEKRINIIQKILSQYKPHCNSDDILESKPDYVVRVSDET